MDNIQYSVSYRISFVRLILSQIRADWVTATYSSYKGSIVAFLLGSGYHFPDSDGYNYQRHFKNTRQKMAPSHPVLPARAITSFVVSGKRGHPSTPPSRLLISSLSSSSYSSLLIPSPLPRPPLPRKLSISAGLSGAPSRASGTPIDHILSPDAHGCNSIIPEQLTVATQPASSLNLQEK